jgi:hypothetical protein
MPISLVENPAALASSQPGFRLGDLPLPDGSNPQRLMRELWRRETHDLPYRFQSLFTPLSDRFVPGPQPEVQRSLRSQSPSYFLQRPEDQKYPLAIDDVPVKLTRPESLRVLASLGFIEEKDITVAPETENCCAHFLKA